MKSAVLGRAFQIPYGGAADFIYTEDVARALVADVVGLIGRAWPEAKGSGVLGVRII